jgi:hypothetical protein
VNFSEAVCVLSKSGDTAYMSSSDFLGIFRAKGDRLYSYETSDPQATGQTFAPTLPYLAASSWVVTVPPTLVEVEATALLNVLKDAWNDSLPDNAPAQNKAPNSPRFQRFLSTVGGQLNVNFTAQ